MPDSAQQPSPGSWELGGSWASRLGRGLAWGTPWLPALHPCWGPSPEFYPHCKIRALYECPKWGERLRRGLPPDATGRGGVTCHPVAGRMTLLRGNPCPIRGPWECFLTQQRGTNGANQPDFQQGAAPGSPGRRGPNCGEGAGGQSQSGRAGLSLTGHRQPGRWREGPRAKKLGSRCSQSLQEGPALRHLGFRPMRPGPDSDLWTVGGDVPCGRSVWGGLSSHRPRPRPQSGQHPPGAVRGHASLQGLGQTLGPPGSGGHALTTCSLVSLFTLQNLTASLPTGHRAVPRHLCSPEAGTTAGPEAPREQLVGAPARRDPSAMPPSRATCLHLLSQGPVLCWAGGREPPTQGSSPLQLLSDEPAPWAPPSTLSWGPRRPDGPSHPSAWRTQRLPSKSSEPGGDCRVPSYPVTPTTRWGGGKPRPRGTPGAHGWSLSPRRGWGAGVAAGPKVGRSRSGQMGRKDGAGTGWGLGEGPGGKAAQPTARRRPRGILHHGPCGMRSEKRF